MKVTEKKNPDGTIELTAVAATAEVAQAFNVAHRSFLANMGLQVGPTQTPAQVAEEELGIGSSHDGIMELPADAPVGMEAREYLHVEDDYLIEIGLTPNRVDAASHIGVARDLAAYLKSRGENAEVKLPDVSAFAPDNHDLEVAVRVENPEAAPRYAGVTVTGCKIGPSPEWMQNCLRAAGINPKNNLVDITNFVLFELGQPLHAFDAAKIEGREVVVRTCAEGTPFVTLDGVERKLTDKDLMICSAERPMCIAGVFGGLDSGVSDTTTDVFIESAYFNPVWVRKTAKRFGLNTDSSFRFERGIDPNMQVYAAKRAALLMKELAGGTISSGITDIYPEPIGDFVFDISLARVNALIGKEIPETVVRTIIAALEVKILAEKDGVLTVAVPPYRVDVQREADLVEDILRIYGYNNVEIPTQVRSTLSYAPKPDRNRLMNLAADFLTANGFTEIMSNSLTKAAYSEGLTSCPAERCVHERLLRFEVQVLEALGEQDRYMPKLLVCQFAHAFRLAEQHAQVDVVILLIEALCVPDLEVARVAQCDDVLVDAGLLTQLGGDADAPGVVDADVVGAALQLAAQADVGLGRGVVTAELAIEQRHDPVLERLRLECVQALVIGAEGYHQIFRKDLAKRGGQGHTALGVYLMSVGAVHVDRLVDAFCHAFLPLLSVCSVRCLGFYPTSSHFATSCGTFWAVLHRR